MEVDFHFYTFDIEFQFIWHTKFSGERTFGVLTKIDLMDKGTDAVDVSFIISTRSCLVLDSRLLLLINNVVGIFLFINALMSEGVKQT